MSEVGWIALAIMVIVLAGVDTGWNSESERTKQMAACADAGGSWSIEWGAPRCTVETPVSHPHTDGVGE